MDSDTRRIYTMTKFVGRDERKGSDCVIQCLNHRVEFRSMLEKDMLKRLTDLCLQTGNPRHSLWASRWSCSCCLDRNRNVTTTFSRVSFRSASTTDSQATIINQAPHGANYMHIAVRGGQKDKVIPSCRGVPGSTCYSCKELIDGHCTIAQNWNSEQRKNRLLVAAIQRSFGSCCSFFDEEETSKWEDGTILEARLVQWR